MPCPRSEPALAAERKAAVKRDTKETQISLSLRLDGDGSYQVETGIGMLDHMLEQLARHGLFDIEIKASGDIERDPHHLVEDVGITLGRALDEALGDRRGIVRFGHAVVPLDESLALVAVDLGGRAYADVQAGFDREVLGGLPTENIEHLLASFATEGRFNLHVRLLSGSNDHHRLEAIFKALARALSDAVRIDDRIAGEVPSTKDVL
jgi:imidazoleglycerol-phosphate dehydratase